MIKQIVERINKLDKPSIIGISGFGGSGKSTLARELSNRIHAPIIEVDSFYNPQGMNNYQLWEIMDYKRLEREICEPFHQGHRTLSYGKFDWDMEQVVNVAVEAQQYLIIEGVGLFRPELMKYFSYKIWIDCPIEVAIKRGKRRDREEYGVIQDKNWDGIWKKNDLQCFQRFNPKENADFIMPYNNNS